MVVTITSVLVVAVLVFIMLMVLKRRRREQRLKRLRGATAETAHCDLSPPPHVLKCFAVVPTAS